MEVSIYLSLGANLGNEIETIQEAISLLSESDILKIEKVSSFYKSEPYGNTNQNWFTNIAICGTTALSESVLLHNCKVIENYLGREVRSRWGEREIDIDILFYGNTTYNSDFLVIPHPEIQKRNFVLVPMNEIAPDFVHPLLNKTINELLKSTPDKLKVIKI